MAAIGFRTRYFIAIGISVSLPMFAISIPVLAHPGRTDSSGCHTCRTNCSSWGLSQGEYHCHRSKGVVQPKEPVRSIRSQGVTVPAPEYKIPKDVKSESSDRSKATPTAKKKEGLLKRFFNWLF